MSEAVAVVPIAKPPYRAFLTVVSDTRLVTLPEVSTLLFITRLLPEALADFAKYELAPL